MKTTKAHFELFKSECERWVEYFSLKDWMIFYEHKCFSDDRGNCGGDKNDKMATIGFAQKIDDFQGDSEVKEIAFHEVCELLLMEMTFSLLAYYSREEVSRLTHTVIHRLENTIFKESMK